MANAIAHPCASYKATRSTHWPAKCAHFGHWHNALVHPTSIRVIILSGGFELEPISDVGTNHGRDHDDRNHADDQHADAHASRHRQCVVVSCADNLAICNRCKSFGRLSLLFFSLFRKIFETARLSWM